MNIHQIMEKINNNPAAVADLVDQHRNINKKGKEIKLDPLDEDAISEIKLYNALQIATMHQACKDSPPPLPFAGKQMEELDYKLRFFQKNALGIRQHASRTGSNWWSTPKVNFRMVLEIDKELFLIGGTLYSYSTRSKGPKIRRTWSLSGHSDNYAKAINGLVPIKKEEEDGSKPIIGFKFAGEEGAVCSDRVTKCVMHAWTNLLSMLVAQNDDGMLKSLLQTRVARTLPEIEKCCLDIESVDVKSAKKIIEACIIQVNEKVKAELAEVERAANAGQ